MEQHDDHIWMTVHGEGWAIRSIERFAIEGGREAMVFFLWRGYAPLLQYLDLMVTDPDWPGYCQHAVEKLEEVYG